MSLPSSFAGKTMASTCTVWIGATNNKGYGIVTVDGRQELAHRIAYMATHGPIPESLVIDHKCRVRNCVKVEHLEPVTTGENVRRGKTAAALSVGDQCINGHAIATQSDLYVKPNGKTECRACRRSEPHRSNRRRPTTQRRAPAVRADLSAADAARAAS